MASELTVPQVNFAPLGELGDIYKKSVNDQGLKDAFAGGVGNDPQSLAALAQKVAPYNPQMGINLAQLAHTIGRQGTQDARQQGLDTFNQNMEQQRLALAQKASARADEGPVETSAQRAAAAKNFGIKPEDPAFKPYVLTGKLPEAADTSFSQTIEQRKQAAQGMGITPEHPAFNSFVLTGKMPREDAQPLTAGDKAAIREADELVRSGGLAEKYVNEAQKLSPQAYSGWQADKRGYLASFLGETSDTGKAGIATTNMNNIVVTNALGQMKAIFGGNPTEGERKILLEIQGSASQPHAVRKEIFARALEAIQNRTEFNKKQAADLRGGSYYKPQGAQTAQPQAAALADPLGIR